MNQQNNKSDLREELKAAGFVIGGEALDRLERLVHQHTVSARIDEVHKCLSGQSFTMPMKSMRTRNTAFKLYAVKFFNTKIKERRERRLQALNEELGVWGETPPLQYESQGESKDE